MILTKLIKNDIARPKTRFILDHVAGAAKPIDGKRFASEDQVSQLGFQEKNPVSLAALQRVSQYRPRSD